MTRRTQMPWRANQTTAQGEEARAAVAGLVVVQDLHIGEPGVVVDADVDELPADAVVLAAPGFG